MFIQPFFIFGLAIIFLCALLLLLIGWGLFYRVNKALSALRNEFTRYKDNNEKEAIEALNRAKQKGQEIIGSTNFFTEEIRKSLISKIEFSVSKGESTYLNLLSELQNKTMSQVVNVEKEMEKEGVSGVKLIRDKFIEESSEGVKKLRDVELEEEAKLKAQINKLYLEEVEAAQRKANEFFKEIVSESVSSLNRSQMEEVVLKGVQLIKKKYGFS